MGKVDIDAWIDRDLSADARDGKLPPAFEVGSLIAEAEDVLGGQGCRSVVFTGPPGIGKSTLVFELIRRAREGEGVGLLAGCRVVQLSLRAIAARFKEKSDATNFFGELCGALLEAKGPPILPYIRDIHLAYQLDWEPTLHRFLMQLPRPILAEALPREFEQLTEYWSDLSEHLVAIPVEEPPLDRVRRIVASWSDWQAQTRGRAITPDAQRIALELTARFMGDKPYPRKVLDLLAQTLDFRGEAEDAGPVDVPDVVHRFSQMTRVPARLVDPDVQLDLTAVHDFFASRLLGQVEAVDAVVRMIALIKAGLADLRRPFGAFLFVGPTGVGKTHCAQLLADYLFGDPNRLVRLNMAEYAHEGQTQLLFGNPYANQPKDQRGLLTSRLQGHPFGVLLLDEFEKAHGKIHDAFLQLMDEGRFINGRSEVVSVSSMIIVATSNAGAEVFRQSGMGFDLGRDIRQLDRELDRRLHRTFRFELINRFDRVVHFHPLSRDDIRSIARRELDELAQRDGLVSRGLQVEVDPEVLDWLVAHGYHPHYGARFLRREIERNVAATLAEHIVREPPPRGATVVLGVHHDRIEARRGEASDVVPRAVGNGGSREKVLAEARAWLQRWAVLRAESEERQRAVVGLEDQSAGSGFWEQPDRAEQLVAEHRSLDARLQMDRRLLQPVERLAEVMDHAETADLQEVTALVERAATHYRRWLDVGAPSRPDAAWLVLSTPGRQPADGRWLMELVDLYRGWLGRRGYDHRVVAEETAGGRIARLALEVEGPGALAVLEMEEGEHQRCEPEGVRRACVEVVPRREADGLGDDPWAVLEATRATRGLLLPRRTARLRLELPGRNDQLVLLGEDRDTLARLSRDLGPALAAPAPPPRVVRTYGGAPGGVRDPRTGASSPHLQAVMGGDLEVFLRAWEAR